MRTGWVLGGLAIAALSGCGSSDTASLVIDGPETALTLERVKAYAWNDEWELRLTVRRYPECQRRHNLVPAAGEGAFKMDLYSPAPGAFIVHQGKHWYVTDLRTCDLQQFKSPPPEPGTRVGAFVEKDGVLRFNPAPQSQTAPAGSGLSPSPAAPPAPALPSSSNT